MLSIERKKAAATSVIADSAGNLTVQATINAVTVNTTILLSAVLILWVLLSGKSVRQINKTVAAIPIAASLLPATKNTTNGTMTEIVFLRASEKCSPRRKSRKEDFSCENLKGICVKRFFKLKDNKNVAMK